MTGRQTSGAPAVYELRVDGLLDAHWATWFGAGLPLTHEDDGTTRLRVAVADQAGLHGLLTRVRDIGATLLSVRLVGGGDVYRPAAPPPRR